MAKRQSGIKGLLKRWFIDALGAMAQGLFASLIIGLIIQQLGKIPGLSFLTPFAQMLSASSPVVGAATVGCCVNMLGFAVASYRENGVGGLISQGLGTSMLQVPNIVRKPVIWLPEIIVSAILGPLSTTLFAMTNNAMGAGMGTSGLVGQFGTIAAMAGSEPMVWILLKMAILQFILPILLTLVITNGMRRAGWIKPGDMKLDL